MSFPSQEVSPPLPATSPLHLSAYFWFRLKLLSHFVMILSLGLLTCLFPLNLSSTGAGMVPDLFTLDSQGLMRYLAHHRSCSMTIF